MVKIRVFGEIMSKCIYSKVDSTQALYTLSILSYLKSRVL